MGKTAAQKSPLPVPAGHGVLPSCSWGTLPGSPDPILHTRLEGKEMGEHQAQGNRSTWSSSSSRRNEDFQILLTGSCYTQSHYLLSQIPVSQVLKSHKGNRRAKLPSYMHLPLSAWDIQTIAYLVTLQVQVHLQHQRKLKPLDASCLLYPKHFSSFRQAKKHIWGTVRKKTWRKCQEVGSSFRVGKTPGLGSCGVEKAQL